MKILFVMLFSISRPFPHTQKAILGKLTNIKTLIHLLPAVLLFILFLLEPALAGAQPLKWQNTFGGSNRPKARDSVSSTGDMVEKANLIAVVLTTVNCNAIMLLRGY